MTRWRKALLAIAMSAVLPGGARAATSDARWWLQYAAFGAPLSAVPGALSDEMRAEGYDEIEPCWIFCPGSPTPHTIERGVHGAFAAYVPPQRFGCGIVWSRAELGTTTGYDGSTTLRLRTVADVWGALCVMRVDAWRGAWIGGGGAAVRARVWDDFAAPAVLLDAWKPGLVLAAGGEQKLAWSLLTTLTAQVVVTGGSELPALYRGAEEPRQVFAPTRLSFTHASVTAGLGMRW